MAPVKTTQNNEASMNTSTDNTGNEVTREFSIKSKKLFEADVHVACTGLIKPGGSETKEKLVGTFFYCIGYKGKIYDFRRVCHGEPEQKLRSSISPICKSIIEVVNQYAD